MVRTRAAHALGSRAQRPGRARPHGHDGGEGTWGLTNDKIVTNAGFIIIVGFPMLVLLLSLLQSSSRSAGLAGSTAAKARSARADLRGGW